MVRALWQFPINQRYESICDNDYDLFILFSHWVDPYQEYSIKFVVHYGKKCYAIFERRYKCFTLQDCKYAIINNDKFKISLIT